MLLLVEAGIHNCHLAIAAPACSKQLASIFFFFGGALSNDTTLRESCACTSLYSCMVYMALPPSNKPWLQLDLCFARLGVCLASTCCGMLGIFACLCFPILLHLRKLVMNSRSHDVRRTAILCTRTAGWLASGMMANTANGGHSHGNADQDPDEGISAPGGKEGEISGGQALLGALP